MAWTLPYIPSFQSCPWEAPWGSRQRVPCPQYKSLSPLSGQEEEVAGSGQAIGPGTEEGKLPGPLLKKRRQSSLLPTTREGCGGQWVGMVLVKIEPSCPTFHPAFC